MPTPSIVHHRPTQQNNNDNKTNDQIAVVTHSSWVHYTLASFGHGASAAVQGDLRRWFENAELRTVVLADPGSTSRPADPTHFAGFASAVAEGPEV